MKKTNRRSKQSSPVDASASATNEKQQYEERIRQLELENEAYQMEIEQLRQKHNDSSVSDNGIEKLKEEYLQKLNLLEEQVTVLKRKLNSQSQFSTQRKRGHEATMQLQFEIQRLKTQKVQLQCKIKLESVQFRICKASLEKENFQLKKEARRKDYENQKLLSSNQRLKMVLQRKTEEASTATKRLRELIESRKSNLKRSSGSINRNDRELQATEQELEVTAQLHELCSQYESQMDKMAEEIAKLKEEAEMQGQEKLRSQLQEKDFDCLDTNFDFKDIQEEVNSLGCLVRQLQLQKEKHNSKDKMQDTLVVASVNQQHLAQPLFTDGSNDKLLEEMNTPETNHLSEAEVRKEKSSEGTCCSCSKKSLCKTTKCGCRSTGENCGPSCGCTTAKCTNRGLNPIKADEPAKFENRESSKSTSAIDETENGSMIASEGAKLLQSALEKSPDFGDNLAPMKKPLCDIQNSLGKVDAQKPGKKKKVRKPIIHLVTEDPYSLLPENNPTDPQKIEAQEDIPLRLDRVMKPATTVDITLTESNSSHSNESATAISNAAGIHNFPRNPTRKAKASYLR